MIKPSYFFLFDQWGERELKYNFIGAKVLEPKDNSQIEVKLFLKPTESDEVLIIKGAVDRDLPSKQMTGTSNY